MRKCKGINTRPLVNRDISSEAAKQATPDCLYWLIQSIITVEGAKGIAQDVIHCCNNSRVKLPKHVGLAVCVYHLTSSKQLVTLLNRMGHCSSYDDIRAVNTSIALEVLAKSEEYGTVIPSNIFAGPFILLAADNNDFNEETIDGKNTTHATTMVIYQRKVFGPAPPPATPVADHSNRRQSLKASSSVYELQECSAHYRRPSITAYVNKVGRQAMV